MASKRAIRHRKPAPTRAERGVEGEGSYAGTRHYNAATRRFVRSGRVEEAARDAAPRNEAEARALEQAEQSGARRARGDDPALAADSNKSRGSKRVR